MNRKKTVLSHHTKDVNEEEAGALKEYSESAWLQERVRVESEAQRWDCSEMRLQRAVEALQRNVCIFKYNGNNWRVLSRRLI